MLGSLYGALPVTGTGLGRGRRQDSSGRPGRQQQRHASAESPLPPCHVASAESLSFYVDMTHTYLMTRQHGRWLGARRAGE